MKFRYFNTCPSCNKGTIFNKFIIIRSTCKSCGINFNATKIGDGAVWVSLFIISIFTVLGAFTLELFLSPPYWYHIVFWPPIIILSSFLLLRIIKYWLILVYIKVKV